MKNRIPTFDTFINEEDTWKDFDNAKKTLFIVLI